MNLSPYFGAYGGRFVSELLMPALLELEAAWADAALDPAFNAELADLLRHYAGRPTPLYHARAMSRTVGCNVFLKREDLLHGGAHKTNNTLGQVLLAKRMGKKRLVAETGAGQHGVATAMVGALLGLPVTVFMGAKDVARQQPNVLRMQLFGAEVRPVEAGSASLKDAINDAMRHWTEHVEDTFYVFGTAAGPHPYPRMVRAFQRVIGDEARVQIQAATGRLPDCAVACVGGGSNAIGLFAAFLDDPSVALVGVEAGGRGTGAGEHGATLTAGTPGIIHGMRSVLLQNDDGQVQEAHSISAGLDYPSVGPEHAHLRDIGRVQYASATDDEALAALQLLARTEGILPALESSHAIAWVLAQAGRWRPTDSVLINLSGRGDKDLAHVGQALGGGQ